MMRQILGLTNNDDTHECVQNILCYEELMNRIISNTLRMLYRELN